MGGGLKAAALRCEVRMDAALPWQPHPAPPPPARWGDDTPSRPPARPDTPSRPPAVLASPLPHFSIPASPRPRNAPSLKPHCSQIPPRPNPTPHSLLPWTPTRYSRSRRFGSHPTAAADWRCGWGEKEGCGRNTPGTLRGGGGSSASAFPHPPPLRPQLRGAARCQPAPGMSSAERAAPGGTGGGTHGVRGEKGTQLPGLLRA